MKVKIYKPIKNPMQSGKAKNHWIIEFPEENTRFIDPVMGWIGNGDTQPQLKMKFDSKEKAIAYAERKGWEYELVLPHIPTTKIQAYSDNFTG